MVFGKKRTGTIQATDNTGRHFLWTIPKFSTCTPGSTLDSENIKCFTKVKFHFHMALGANGDVGVYVHYKACPIPKYSYYFENSKQQVMRQHTAHTIPSDTERCGHWNVCNHDDMKVFLGTDDVLRMRFSFDDDTITIKRFPDQNIISVMWTVPALFDQNLNPFSSRGFFIDSTLLVMRLDCKRAVSGVISPYNSKDITSLIFFLFARKGRIPPHSIELLDSDGAPYFHVDKKDDGTAQTLLVDRAMVDKHLLSDGVLFVRVNLHTGGNPLEALNVISGLAQAPANGADDKRQVEVGEKKELYDVMDD